MANTAVLLHLFSIIYISSIGYANEIIWRLNLSNFCVASAAWKCSNNYRNYLQSDSECNSIPCVKLHTTGWIQIENISTTNQYDLILSYTVGVKGLNDAEYFFIKVLNDKGYTLASYDTNDTFNPRTFNVSLNDSLSNQQSISFRFKVAGSGSGDLGYIYSAVLYSDDPYSPSIIIPTSEPTFEPTTTTTTTVDDTNKVSFGTEYKDTYMLILGVSMFSVAVLIIIYFRCCKKRMDAKKAAAVEKQQKQMEMQQALNTDTGATTDEQVKKEDDITNENEKEKHEEKMEKKDKVKSETRKGKNEKGKEKQYDKVLAASPTTTVTVSIDVTAENDD